MHRTLVVTRRQPETSTTPGAAIAGGHKWDVLLRSVPDDAVRGRVIQSFQYDDSALCFRLDDGTFLNCWAKPHGVACSIDTSSKAVGTRQQDETVLVEFHGSKAYEWRRHAIASRRIGEPLTRLWFGEHGIGIYTPRALLMCYLVLRYPDQEPLLIWNESE